MSAFDSAPAPKGQAPDAQRPTAARITSLDRLTSHPSHAVRSGCRCPGGNRNDDCEKHISATSRTDSSGSESIISRRAPSSRATTSSNQKRRPRKRCPSAGSQAGGRAVRPTATRSASSGAVLRGKCAESQQLRRVESFGFRPGDGKSNRVDVASERTSTEEKRLNQSRPRTAERVNDQIQRGRKPVDDLARQRGDKLRRVRVKTVESVGFSTSANDQSTESSDAQSREAVATTATPEA